MSLNRIVMRLARNPGTEFADGDDHRGYALIAPLTGEGKLDAAAFRAHKADFKVRHFAPDEDPQEGKLAHRGERWFFDYGDDAEADQTHQATRRRRTCDGYARFDLRQSASPRRSLPEAHHGALRRPRGVPGGGTLMAPSPVPPPGAILLRP